MKKNYIQPDMQVVKLQPRYRLLVGSNNPSGYNNSKVSSFRGEGEQLTSEDDIF